MRRLIFFILLVCNAALVFAQKADTNKAIKTHVNGTAMSPVNNTIGNLAASPEFTTFLKALKVVGLTDDTFKGIGPVTIFAPTNEAFEKLAPGELDSLMLPANKEKLTNLLNNHIIAGKITSKDIGREIKAGKGQATFKTLSGGTLTAVINANRNIVLTDENGDQSVVSRFDIQQSNGILHVVNALLVPKVKP